MPVVSDELLSALNDWCPDVEVRSVVTSTGARALFSA
jgi:hypothetical protein